MILPKKGGRKNQSCFSKKGEAVSEQYHLVVTAPRREASVMEGLGRQGVSSFYPILRRRYQRRDGDPVVEKTLPLFPGYMFVERPSALPKYWRAQKGSALQSKGAAPTNLSERLADIAHADGVLGFVRFGLEPIIVPEETIRKVRRIMEDGCFVEDMRTRELRYLGSEELWKPRTEAETFKVGESVRIADGPFGSFIAEIIEAPVKDRIKVILNIFGRHTEVSLETSQVEALT